ncbi:cyclin-dependent kinase 20 isoform X1 [Hippopotamus amphibius kiboko]|uniref:cyclin-dependent kinase 20 isoform X1 n=1 Tax=Hippopotamus amphibius kiboko TaxID=575201 RepID=UPI002593091E|nr:cyclin-dependent kinase 20 isoform X1 [Hippopotamus amphibius kiboko]
MEQYCILGRIGEGAHGIVFKAKHVETGEIVALKKVALRRLEDGIPNQALREIKALQEIEDSQYVVQLKAVFPHGAGFVLAFEFMLSDLAEVVRHAQRPLAQAQVKSYLQMLLKGVAFCHANNIVHRDLKPANLLISASGQLKIADFGLARVFSPDGSRLYTHQVATRWYRAPELLYGARQYDQGVDLWAVGCILGELLNGSPLFPGENDIEQLCCVLRILGTPSPQVWPEVAELPDYNKISFKEQAPVPLEQVLPDASPQALDLLGRFLLYPPRQRIAASQDNPGLLFLCSSLIRPPWSCSQPGHPAPAEGTLGLCYQPPICVLLTGRSEGGSEFRCHAHHGASSLVAAFLVRDGPGGAIWGSTECKMSSCWRPKWKGKFGLILFSKTLNTSSLLRFIIKTLSSSM